MTDNNIKEFAKKFIELAIINAINRIEYIIKNGKKLPLSEKERKDQQEELPDFNKMTLEERKEQDWGAAKIQASFRGKEARKNKENKKEDEKEITPIINNEKIEQQQEELPDFNKMTLEERKEQDWGAAKIQASFRGKESRKNKENKKEDGCRSPIPPDRPQPSTSSPRKTKK
jgi:hypothetical protein